MEINCIKHLIPAKMYLSHKYKKIFNRKLNWKNPKTYNEKLQWLKLNDKNTLYTELVDKYKVKSIVGNIVGWKYVIPTIGIYDNAYDINFARLPKQFVIKCTHDSGSYIVCSNKKDLDVNLCIKKINTCLKHNYYWNGREWPYKNVKPRVIIEQFIGYYPRDYKFFVFNGIIDSIMVCVDRDKGHPSFYFYDTKWNRVYYQHQNLEQEKQIEKPKNFDLMIQLVNKLAKGFRHVRVDFYNLDGKVFFGEFTLYNQSGFDTEITYETDLKWGHLLNLQ